MARAGDGRWTALSLVDQDPLFQPAPAAEAPLALSPEDFYRQAQRALARHPGVRVDPDGASPVADVPLGVPSLARVRRRALYSPGAGQFEFALALPARGRLEFFHGLLSDLDGVPAPGARFSVELLAEGEPPVLLFSTSVAAAPPPLWSPPGGWFHRLARPFHTEAGRDGDRWHRAGLALDRWAGQRVRLRFRTEPLSGGRNAVSHAFWAEPAIWVPREDKAPPENLVLIVLESMGREDAGAQGALEGLTPNLGRLIHEAVDFQRAYANAVPPGAALASLLFSRTAPVPGEAPPSLASVLREEGYRTAAMGALPVGEEGAGNSLGDFEELYLFEREGYDTVHTCRAAAEWIARRSGDGPFFLLIYLRDGPAPFWPPVRFWARAFPRVLRVPGAWPRWGAWARAAYVDEYLGRVFDVLDALRLWDRSLVSLVSLRGASRADGPDELREEGVRVLWVLKQASLAQGQSVGVPAQLLSVAPTLLRRLGRDVPDVFEGAVFEKTFSSSLSGAPAPEILIRGRHGKALLLESHYKYIRHFPSVSPGRGRPSSGREEVYDLWTDPGERFNLARRERHLLGRLRQAMDETAPDPTETRLLFWDLQGKTVQGSVQVPAGELTSFGASGTFAGRGSSQFDFEITASSGEVFFEITPPLASFVLRLRIDDKNFSTDQIMTSKLGLPLFERGGVEWYDRNNFPWMEGLAAPLGPEPGPLVFMGRVPRRDGPAPSGGGGGP